MYLNRLVKLLNTAFSSGARTPLIPPSFGCWQPSLPLTFVHALGHTTTHARAFEHVHLAAPVRLRVKVDPLSYLLPFTFQPLGRPW